MSTDVNDCCYEVFACPTMLFPLMFMPTLIEFPLSSIWLVLMAAGTGFSLRPIMLFPLMLMLAVIGFSCEPYYANTIACISMLAFEFLTYVCTYIHMYGHICMGDEPNPPLIRFLCFRTQPMRKLVPEGYLRPVVISEEEIFYEVVGLCWFL